MLFITRGSCFYFSLAFYLAETRYFIELELLRESRVSLVYLIMLDWIRLMFISVVFFISSIVLIYSSNYIKGNIGLSKFIYIIFLFVISMALIIMSPNMIRILLGWDGLGLVSYCLVIYYQNIKSYNSGILTILSNRLGDIAILLSIRWLVNYGSFNIYYWQFMNYDVSIILFLVVFAAITKSAQIPFSAWLPAAIAAPTPVSSLVHSSTLVTAGVYLLIRFHNLLRYNIYLMIISILTLFISGLRANYEMDLKKIIALSTLSQLGIIIFILSLGQHEIAFFHLVSHAIFKSLLFLCAGYYIHTNINWQDIRSLNSLSLNSPIISFYFFVSSVSLCGFPFLTGFYSKDLIIEFFLITKINIFLLTILFISTLLTLIYSTRLVYYLYFNRNFFSPRTLLREDEEMYYPMFFLFIFSVLIGSFFSWLFFPIIYIYIRSFTKVLLLVFLTFSLLAFFNMNSLVSPPFTHYLIKKLYFIRLIWNLPFISTIYFTSLLKKGLWYIKITDQGWFEFLGAQGSYKIASSYAYGLDKSNILNLKSFFLMFFYFILTLIFLIYLNSLNVKA